MGRIIELDTDLLVPSQHKLIMSDAGIIVRSYFRRPKKMLLPVRIHPCDCRKYLLLDGNHSACIADTLNELDDMDIEVFGWLAEHNGDLIGKLPIKFYQKDIVDKNENIEGRYYSAIRPRPTSLTPPQSVKAMRALHPQFESAETLLDYAFHRRKAKSV